MFYTHNIMLMYNKREGQKKKMHVCIANNVLENIWKLQKFGSKDKEKES